MKRSGNKLISMAIGILGAVWALAILILAGMRDPAIHFAGSLSFSVIAVVAAVTYLSFLRLVPGRQAVEPGALSIIVTAAYVLISLGANTALILINLGGFNQYLIVRNIIINAVYVVLILYVERDTRRLKEQLDCTEAKTAASVNISEKLGALLGIAEDGEIRSRLLKLKEMVDYGTNITTASTTAQEQQMAGYLDELMNLLMANSRKELVIEKIQQAERCWKMRSSTASSIK